MPSILEHTTPEVFNPQTGRLDATRFASFLHLPARDLAAITGKTSRYVRANPDADSFQPPLQVLLRIINGLKRLTGGQHQMVLIWLRSPHPDLEGQLPMDLITAGRASVVLDLVEDMLTGAPA